MPSVSLDLQSAGRWSTWHASDEPLRLGVSTCLLGESVRYDGGHCRDRFLVDVLGEWVEWVPTCPELEIGLGVPRPTIRLVDEGQGTRLVEPDSGTDLSPRMERFARKRLPELEAMDLDGYVFKKNSPSCGISRLKVYRGSMPKHKAGVGLFAASVMERWPQLPVEEEGRLNDAMLRENFIERIFCRQRWKTLVAGGRSRRRLVLFHTAHKLLVRAHDEAGYRELGRIAAAPSGVSTAQLFQRYELALQTALSKKATRRKHTNVLQHALGYMKKLVPSKEKAEIVRAIEDYRQGLLPLVVPVTLLRFNIHRFDIEYLLGQLYFDPHPKELMLRNHA